MDFIRPFRRFARAAAEDIGSIGSEVVEPREVPGKVFPRNRRDAYYAAFLLSQVIVPDLVPYILDLAEYWVVESEHTNHAVTVKAHNSVQQRKPCLSTPTLNDFDYGRVRKIVFTIQSKDQGWSSYPASYGTYNECQSWFAVSNEGSEVCTGDRFLQNNMHAGQYLIIHEITWTAYSDNAEERQWVKSLQNGQLTVNALAQYPGWSNQFKSGRIDVYFTPVVRL